MGTGKGRTALSTKALEVSRGSHASCYNSMVNTQRLRRSYQPLVRAGVVLFLILIAMGIYFFFGKETSLPPPPADALYKQAQAPLEKRVNDLVSRMSLREKIGQMALVEKNSVRVESDVASYGLGALLSGMGARPEENTVAGWKAMIDTFSATANESRLGIPVLYGVDAIHGHSNVVRLPSGLSSLMKALWLPSKRMVVRLRSVTKSRWRGSGF